MSVFTTKLEMEMEAADLSSPSLVCPPQNILQLNFSQSNRCNTSRQLPVMPAHPKRAAPRAEAGLHGGEALSPLASTFEAALGEVSVMSSLEGQLSSVDSAGDVPATFVSLAQTSTAPPATPIPPSAFSTSVDDATLVSVSLESKSRGKRAKKAASNAPPQPVFAWTSKAAETLLRVRFVTMKHRFQGTKSSKQLAAAWSMIAAETFRLGDLQVDAGQCKSKLKHMHKQFTAYRVALQDTGNATEKQLKEPACYETMCDVWSDHDGMDADPFFSSDAPENAADQHLSENDTEGSQSGGGWRRVTGKRTREKAEAAEGMIAIGEGLHSIAEAFKVSRTQGGDLHNRELLSSIRELSQTVQTQTLALNNLIQHLGANVGNSGTNSLNSYESNNN